MRNQFIDATKTQNPELYRPNIDQSMNRETWLERMCYEFVIPHFSECGYPELDVMANYMDGQKFQFSTSFIEGTRTSKAIGVHYQSSCSSNGFTQNIMIHPKLHDSVQVVGVLIHECVHAMLEGHLTKDLKPIKPHGKEFRAVALKVGLTGKMTATTESDELKKKIKKWVGVLGEYPHIAMDVNKSGRKKQTTRMIKVQCESGFGDCSGTYKVRMSRTLIMKYGEPICPCCQFPMMAEDFE
jgi:predicted SprT family Zn-dependent metalloprotease